MATAEHLKIGKLGEDLACRYLIKRGYRIVERNYLKKWGEIDIVAQNKDGISIIEVKTVTRGTESDVSRETDSYRPEDNMHRAKVERLKRVIQTYLAKKTVSRETDWKFCLITVVVGLKDKTARINFIKDIILE